MELDGMMIETREGRPHVVRTSWSEKQGARTVLVSLRVDFGLHYIRGNRAPYFSITADGREDGRESFGGCCHEIIAARFPALRDVIALHLADINGAPMHAEGNGFYWLAGIVGGLGERYHGANDGRHNADACARIFADHARVSVADARTLANRCASAFNRARDAASLAAARDRCTAEEATRAGIKAGTFAAKRVAREFCDAQRERWHAEALRVIERYSLGVHGDMQKTNAETLAMHAAAHPRNATTEEGANA